MAGYLALGEWRWVRSRGKIRQGAVASWERGLPRYARPGGSLRLAISAALRFSCPHRELIAAEPPGVDEAMKNRALRQCRGLGRMNMREES